MRRIAKLAFAAATAAAAGWAIRQLAEQRREAAGALPSAELQIGEAGASNGAIPPASAGESASGGSPTREQLYREARRLQIKGRSKMNKQELQEAIEAVKTGGVE